MSSAPPAISVPDHIAQCAAVETVANLIEEATDPLLLFIKGHHFVDLALNAALTEALPKADSVELTRIAFLLKADFGMALGLMQEEMRPLFSRLNSYRNKFAHAPMYVIDAAYSAETLRMVQALFPKILEGVDPPTTPKTLHAERRLIFGCYVLSMYGLREACKRHIALDVTSLSIETMPPGFSAKADAIRDLWRQSEIRLLQERYPTIFSFWPP